MDQEPIAVVVIGRNEGERLRRCLRSIPDNIPVVYVDSGSTDDSVAFAREIGITALPLDMSIGFTAARARNVGWRHIAEQGGDVEFIQFVDGDCVLDDRWLNRAVESIRSEQNLAAVFGRRRELFPNRSIYNQMCDDEWNVPIGIAASCGGDALFRMTALQAAAGYSDDLIAGEEPDLCLRLRQSGWTIRRIDADMTRHDANILAFGNWWQRAKRGGFAYAAHVLRHGRRSDPPWTRQLRSIAVWGFIWPVSGILLTVFCGLWNLTAGMIVGAVLIGSYAGQFLRIAIRKHSSGATWRFSIPYAALIVAGKFAEMSGALRCLTSHSLNRQNRLIEYKGTA